MVFKEGNTWYAVGLEFNIVEAGDDPREVLLRLFEAIRGYVNSARKIKARPFILNQKPDSEYETLWKRRETNAKPLIYTFGQQSLQSLTTA